MDQNYWNVSCLVLFGTMVPAEPRLVLWFPLWGGCCCQLRWGRQLPWWCGVWVSWPVIGQQSSGRQVEPLKAVPSWVLSRRSAQRDGETQLFLTALSLCPPPLPTTLFKAKFVVFTSSSWQTDQSFIILGGSPLTPTSLGRHGNGYQHAVLWWVSAVRGAREVSTTFILIFVKFIMCYKSTKIYKWF